MNKNIIPFKYFERDKLNVYNLSIDHCYIGYININFICTISKYGSTTEGRNIYKLTMSNGSAYYLNLKQYKDLLRKLDLIT